MTEVRQVVGYEGQHVTDTSRDVLIIGAGYDDKLIAEVAEHKDQARKIQLFGLPSLRADMYQENVLRAHLAESAVGTPIHDEASNFFAPANDPIRYSIRLARNCHRSTAARPDYEPLLEPACDEGTIARIALLLPDRMP